MSGMCFQEWAFYLWYFILALNITCIWKEDICFYKKNSLLLPIWECIISFLFFFFGSFYLEIISNQKKTKNNTENTCIPFTQIHVLLAIFLMALFKIFSVLSAETKVRLHCFVCFIVNIPVYHGFQGRTASASPQKSP